MVVLSLDRFALSDEATDFVRANEARRVYLPAL
jgi:hypothetical protein